MTCINCQLTADDVHKRCVHSWDPAIQRVYLRSARLDTIAGDSTNDACPVEGRPISRQPYRAALSRRHQGAAPCSPPAGSALSGLHYGDGHLSDIDRRHCSAVDLTRCCTCSSHGNLQLQSDGWYCSPYSFIAAVGEKLAWSIARSPAMGVCARLSQLSHSKDIRRKSYSILSTVWQYASTVWKLLWYILYTGNKTNEHKAISNYNVFQLFIQTARQRGEQSTL